MTWQNPLAFLGLFALVIPLAAHLFSRRRAQVLPFPSLRFIVSTRLLPTRVTSPSDIPLMLLRMLVIAMAVVALAQPVAGAPNASRSSLNDIRRLVLVDTSASMQRIIAGTTRVVDSARGVAASFNSDGTVIRVLETARPSVSINGAASWMNAQGAGAVQEIVVISDFQNGEIDSVAFAGVPDHIGLKLLQILPADSAAQPGLTTIIAGRKAHVRYSFDAEATTASWETTNDSAVGATHIEILAGRDSLIVDAVKSVGASQSGALIANGAQGQTAITSNGEARRGVTILHTDHAAFGTMLSNAVAPDAPWMVDLVTGLRRDVVLSGAARGNRDSASRIGTDAPKLALVAANGRGIPVVSAGRDPGDSSRILLFNQGDVASELSVALLVAVNHAMSVPIDLSEYDDTYLTPARLSGWERKASALPQSSRNSTSDIGRWLWASVLVLLGVETWARRERA